MATTPEEIRRAKSKFASPDQQNPLERVPKISESADRGATLIAALKSSDDFRASSLTRGGRIVVK